MCVYRCLLSQWKRPPSSPFSRRNWPSCQVKHLDLKEKKMKYRHLFPQSCGHPSLSCNLIPPLSHPSACHSLGGKDRRSGLILNIPLSSDQTSMEELSATLDYLLSIPRYTQRHDWGQSGVCPRAVVSPGDCWISLLMLLDMFGFWLVSEELLDLNPMARV